MAPTKAVAWPESIYEDADVLSLDEQGRFILCRVCAESFAALGGKTPKPVTMNACFRMRAWEVHKRRTRAHRKTRSISSPRGRISSPVGDPSAAMPSQESERLAQDSLFVQQAAATRSTAMQEFNLQYAHFTDDLAIVESYGRTSEERPMSFQHLLASETGVPSATVGGHQNGVVAEQTSAQISEISHGLDRILNPMAMDWEDKAEPKESSIRLRKRTDKRQRSSCSEEEGAFASAGCSATHALYWKTMRELFSSNNGSVKRNGARQNSSSQSPNGDTDGDAWSH